MQKITTPLPPFSDHVYAVKRGVELPLRIFPCPSPVGLSTGRRSWLLYIHGGAGMAGQHWYPFPWWLQGSHDRGYHVASISYRLAPHARLEDMLEDCADAHSWLRSNLGYHLPGGRANVDIHNYALGGFSGGGMLSLLLASGIPGSGNGTNAQDRCFRLDPPPRVVVNLYGLSDFTDPFYYASTPVLPTDAHPLSGKFSVSELEAGERDDDLSRALIWGVTALDTPSETLAQGWQTDQVKYDRRLLFQLDLMYHVRSQKRLLNMLLRERETSSSEEWQRYVRSVNPLDNISASFPPTVNLHGDADTMVPIHNSRRLADKLRSLGVEVLEVYQPGQKHGFDRQYDTPEVPGWDTYIKPVLDFVDAHLQ